MSLLTMLKDLHRIAVPRPTLELPCRTLGEYGNNAFFPAREKQTVKGRSMPKGVTLPILFGQSNRIVGDSIGHGGRVEFLSLDENVSVAFRSTGLSFFRRDVPRDRACRGRGRTVCRLTTHFKSSSNSLQLNRVISDVNAAGMTIIGVLDGRFDESVVDRASLSLAEAIGFGMEIFAMD